jgi:hypothetical protein
MVKVILVIITGYFFIKFLSSIIDKKEKEDEKHTIYGDMK